MTGFVDISNQSVGLAKSVFGILDFGPAEPDILKVCSAETPTRSKGMLQGRICQKWYMLATRTGKLNYRTYFHIGKPIFSPRIELLRMRASSVLHHNLLLLMLALKRLVTILVMVFLLLALLVLLLPSVRASFVGMAGTPEALYFGLLIAAVVLLGLQLITENLDSVLLRREVTARDAKINELKARLYDYQMEQRTTTERAPGAPRTGTTTYPDGEPRSGLSSSDPGLSNAPHPTPLSPPDAPNRPA